MLRYLATALLCTAPFGCGEGGTVEDLSSAPASAQTTDAARMDAGRNEDGGTVIDASPAGDAQSPASGADATATGPSGVDACRGVRPSGSNGPALHAAAAALLTEQAPCGFSACHTGSSRARAGLRLLGATDLRTLLVGRAACEAPRLSLVDGSGGPEALARSWLWQKLAAPTDSSSALHADPSWGDAEACGQDPAEPFGLQMPLASGPLEDIDLSAVRSWICAGAPGPT